MIDTLIALSNKREQLVNDDFDGNEKEIDKLADEIHDIIFKIHERLPIDFLIEELNKLGHSVNVVYDDDGHYAVTSDGSVSIDPKSFERNCVSNYIESGYWCDNIRSAMSKYILSLKDE